jgi:hypothetical protein
MKKFLLNNGDWGRVVSKSKEFFLINLYSDLNVAGGPVFDMNGNLIGVLSTFLYKNGKQSAFLVAKLKDTIF